MYLYHYFDKRSGPFKSLTGLPEEEAASLFRKMRDERSASFGAQRSDDYLDKRRRCEEIVRSEFIKKGGKPKKMSPHYLTVEHCPWLSSWYEQSDFVKIPVEDIDTSLISFTYGDSMPTFSPLVTDGKEYRRKVYTYEEIIKVIEKYGLPQEWNADGKFGPERYIEANLWSDEPIRKYLTSVI